jgi:hypothetical protein
MATHAGGSGRPFSVASRLRVWLDHVRHDSPVLADLAFADESEPFVRKSTVEKKAGRNGAGLLRAALHYAAAAAHRCGSRPGARLMSALAASTPGTNAKAPLMVLPEPLKEPPAPSHQCGLATPRSSRPSCFSAAPVSRGMCPFWRFCGRWREHRWRLRGCITEHSWRPATPNSRRTSSRPSWLAPGSFFGRRRIGGNAVPPFL